MGGFKVNGGAFRPIQPWYRGRFGEEGPEVVVSGHRIGASARELADTSVAWLAECTAARVVPRLIVKEARLPVHNLTKLLAPGPASAQRLREISEAAPVASAPVPHKVGLVARRIIARTRLAGQAGLNVATPVRRFGAIC